MPLSILPSSRGETLIVTGFYSPPYLQDGINHALAICSRESQNPAAFLLSFLAFAPVEHSCSSFVLSFRFLGLFVLVQILSSFLWGAPYPNFLWYCVRMVKVIDMLLFKGMEELGNITEHAKQRHHIIGQYVVGREGLVQDFGAKDQGMSNFLKNFYRSNYF
ncbi:NADH dehydrogenase (ubiquinone) 1 alpha subcomplex subunit 6 [Cucumis melo var. makuwa]|uniref:NADH dehydrogenase (Ubiquinone) 1 alpha subcomplex subunit 6 n=1 Tax=Cucumis melo var. makuwa TaxID=1194695 RepID=A0A5A7SUY5_CUCMM|nr:NADH dehydrogenase (ubiquinone) 1 alpha subcomplex subunit 6 [Cucumis melo var. makuwa]